MELVYSAPNDSFLFTYFAVFQEYSPGNVNDNVFPYFIGGRCGIPATL